MTEALRFNEDKNDNFLFRFYVPFQLFNQSRLCKQRFLLFVLITFVILTTALTLLLFELIFTVTVETNFS